MINNEIKMLQSLPYSIKIIFKKKKSVSSNNSLVAFNSIIKEVQTNYWQLSIAENL